MIFELHLTVDHDHPDFDLDDWCALCEHHGAKPLDIRLAHGRHDRQVMFAAVHEGSNRSAGFWKAGLSAEVEAGGFVILRSKLEVPLDKSAPYTSPVYHECHIKSLLPADERDEIVGKLTDAGWLASWNDLFPRDTGREKWYFTLRSYSTDFIQAGRDFAEAYAALAEINWFTVRMESETVIQDSNPDLDEGWA